MRINDYVEASVDYMSTITFCHSLFYPLFLLLESGYRATVFIENSIWIFFVFSVVKQIYEVQVYDEYVIKGNTAVMKCHIPSFVVEYVKVISWSQVETGARYSSIDLGKLKVSLNW